jgi:aspartate/methionine/tyrosine aminotransferase
MNAAMKISSRILQMVDAPIDALNRERLRLEREVGPIFNLGQAIPYFSPPPIVREATLRALDDPNIHLYTPDPGLPELRQAIAGSVRRKFGATVQPEDIVVTAGANHAFLLVCSVLLGEGDRVGLLSPYFLNHKMAVEGCGGVAIEINPDEGGRYSAESVERALVENDLRALVVVNPSNPTGKVFSLQELRLLLDLCRKHRVWLVADEVYNSFVYPPLKMVSLASLPDAADATWTIGSFSKEFGMTGWRLGWLQAPRALVHQVLKVQDYSIICASRLAQVVAVAALEHAPDWSMSHLERLAARRTELLSILAGSNLFEIFDSQGAFFVWMRPLHETDSAREVLDIMARARVCIVPGLFFGEAWRGWFRISYGSLALEQLCVAVQALVGYFTASRFS